MSLHIHQSPIQLSYSENFQNLWKQYIFLTFHLQHTAGEKTKKSKQGACSALIMFLSMEENWKCCKYRWWYKIHLFFKKLNFILELLQRLMRYLWFSVSIGNSSHTRRNYNFHHRFLEILSWNYNGNILQMACVHSEISKISTFPSFRHYDSFKKNMELHFEQKNPAALNFERC